MKLITWIVLLIFTRIPWLQKADSLINPPLMQQAEKAIVADVKQKIA
jgi:energy-converting hydrogenase Eha subunit H